MKKMPAFLISNCPIVLLGLEALVSNETHFSEVSSFNNVHQLFATNKPKDTDDAFILVACESYELKKDELAMLSQCSVQGARILFYSKSLREEDIWIAVSNGATGYLPRILPLPTVTEGIQCVMEGKSFCPSIVQEALSRRAQRISLSRREQEILELVCDGLTNEQIGQTLKVSVPTIRFHVSNLLLKMNARNRTDATFKALRRGLVSLSPPAPQA